MPELPEVETIKRNLQKELTHKTILRAEIDTPSLIMEPQLNEYLSKIQNNQILKIKRRGKYIIFSLDTQYQLIVHLGMSGRLEYQPKKQSYKNNIKTFDKHNHLFFFLNDGSILVYNDIRKFGKIWFLKKQTKLSRIENLGFEPLGKEFTFVQFLKLLKNCKTNIKKLLMDQKKIAGIGNIYANEILFHSGIHPLRKSNLLSREEAKKLYVNIKKILIEAIKLNGTTMLDESFRDLKGNKGRYGSVIKVYGKKNGICPVCGRHLQTIRIDNRSTFLCPNCQK
jgi:formamidopyrimidine-DNA glycosylase